MEVELVNGERTTNKVFYVIQIGDKFLEDVWESYGEADNYSLTLDIDSAWDFSSPGDDSPKYIRVPHYTWQELLTAADVAKAMNGKLLQIKEEMTVKRKLTAVEIT